MKLLFLTQFYLVIFCHLIVNLKFDKCEMCLLLIWKEIVK